MNINSVTRSIVYRQYKQIAIYLYKNSNYVEQFLVKKLQKVKFITFPDFFNESENLNSLAF